MASELSDEREIFENTFYHFIDALRILALDAEAQCERMGDYNVPWEIQSDVTKGGSALLQSSCSYLTHEQAKKLLDLITALKELPEQAIAPPNMMTTNHLGSIKAMQHSAWAPIRRDAADMLKLLDTAIQQNAAYFPNGEKNPE